MINIILFLLGLNTQTGTQMQSLADTINEKGISLNYESYRSWITTDQKWQEKAKTMTLVWIYNPEGILIKAGENLPVEGGVLFEDLQTLSAFKEVKHIRLDNLHISDIPDSFVDLQKLERLDIAFTDSADLKHSIKVLSQLKSLKQMNIDASTLTTAKRKAFVKAMKVKGVTFNSIFD